MIALFQPLDGVSATAKGPLGILVPHDITHLGKRYRNWYRYVVAGGTITRGRYCEYNGDTPFEVVNTNTAGRGNLLGCGIAQATAASGEYFWAMEQGVDAINTYSVSALSGLQAAAADGTMAAATISTNEQLNVGIVTIDDVAILWGPGRAGFYPDQT
jgi:hypothetical protein